MKRVWTVLLAFVLCAGMALAEDDHRAATWRDAALYAAPEDGAEEIMHYFAGTRVEIVRDVDDAFACVNVGTEGGSQTGYMEKSLLVFGEESIRKVYPARRVYEQLGWTLYGHCDKQAEVISENSDTFLYAIGENDEWVHALVTSGSTQQTGFVNKAEAGLTKDMGYMESCTWMYTEPLEGELTFDEAVDYAKNVILEAGTMANGQQGVPVTGEMLDSCRVSVDIQWDINEYFEGALSDEQVEELGIDRPQTNPLCYVVTFYYSDRTWEDGFPMICALACLYVEGDEVVTYDFGKG